MRKTYLKDALKGIKIWRDTINCETLTLVIPKFESEIVESIPGALMHFKLLERSINEKVRIIFSDVRIKELVWDKQLNIEYIRLPSQDMDNLVSYMLWTSKHISAMRNANVKLVMLDGLCGGQIRRVYDMQLFSNDYIIYDRIIRGV